MTLHDGLRAIGHNSFYGCEALTSIDIPSTVTEIDNYAFESCKSLEIEIPSTVQYIGENALKDVKHIKYNGKAEGAPWGALKIN